MTTGLIVEPLDRCFAPVVSLSVRVLILGSLPGQRSLSAGQYYAHPQNQFWRLLGGVIGEDLGTLDYKARLETLIRHNIGLWDTVAKARRNGSLDSALQNITPTNLSELVGRLPNLRLIAFNGQKAAMVGKNQITGIRQIAWTILPSSSPAYTLPFDRKLTLWRAAMGPSLGRAF